MSARPCPAGTRGSPYLTEEVLSARPCPAGHHGSPCLLQDLAAAGHWIWASFFLIPSIPFHHPVSFCPCLGPLPCFTSRYSWYWHIYRGIVIIITIIIIGETVVSFAEDKRIMASPLRRQRTVALACCLALGKETAEHSL